MSLNEEILEILVCPKCRGDLRLTEQADGLVCEACALVYPVENDIPVLLVEDAKPLAADQAGQNSN